MSIVESFNRCEEGSEVELETFLSTQVQPGYAAFPLSVSDWNSFSMDEAFPVNLYPTSFDGGTGLEMPFG